MAEARHKPINVFGDDDDDGAIGQDIARHAEQMLNDKKVTQMHAAALAEDASVFDYDGVYDSIQEARVQPRQQEKLARKSRYIEGLLDKAKEREREQDIIYERTLLKERAAEDHLFGDKDKFVTAAYKKKLEEDQKWLAAERIREARDAKADVVKAGHMGNFYRDQVVSVFLETEMYVPLWPGLAAHAVVLDQQDELFSAAYSGASSPFSPAAFLYAWWCHADHHLAGYQQQDAHEFYLFTLSGLSHSRLPSVSNNEPTAAAASAAAPAERQTGALEAPRPVKQEAGSAGWQVPVTDFLDLTSDLDSCSLPSFLSPFPNQEEAKP
ncbi:hypothetical protein COCSUDRAFT_58842 [Coccomyxa subellipsoidea C-169]|uniref:Nuclear speckle splicing regulatory protein 1 N-terminal domain-containing protein n=1 Tax=Coccomyxa subellipsoidea (strain C-169) TaxID=574566 RepID=I0Z6N3_COCSC|nr:hypothetical protein COCSUDRAFT_58842 [Coccomyxa subellipsoidea C-169]EIE26302.1 hypothetical protein COCSUDRAFT_58842 [Coccomyxa subellipsoidea C-169]|eukprot:XP_005650846.1 hypothetical protein COCSUDRAFT_58842 [Coccomyxa subellipsoidea C-169]